jgi:hypothetical protein
MLCMMCCISLRKRCCSCRRGREWQLVLDTSADLFEYVAYQQERNAAQARTCISAIDNKRGLPFPHPKSPSLPPTHTPHSPG